MGPRTGLDVLEKRQISCICPPPRQGLVTMLTTLHPIVVVAAIVVVVVVVVVVAAAIAVVVVAAGAVVFLGAHVPRMETKILNFNSYCNSQNEQSSDKISYKI